MKRNNCMIVAFMSLLLLTGCETAFMRDLSGKKVILLAPVNSLTTTDSIQTFYWDRLTDAEQYRLQIVSPKFDSIVKLIADTTVATDRFIMEMKKGMYQWRVRAINSGSESGEGDTWNLTIQ